MGKSIIVNNDLCIACGKCAAVCPSTTFVMGDKSALVQNLDMCIDCGHCVAVCGESAISHSVFPLDKIHPVDYSLYPTAEQMLHLCKARRSNRAFSKKPVPRELLMQIVEAAHRAPTASNMQQVAFTVITDPEKLKVISDFTMNTFGKMLKTIGNPFVKPIVKIFMPSVMRYIPVFKKMQAEYANGNDGILRNATAVILIHSPRGSRFGGEDANLAYQNGSLMAECLGVSQFYMGFVLTATKQNKKGELEKALLMPDQQIYAAMALGMPKFKYTNYVDRKDLMVNEF